MRRGCLAERQEKRQHSRQFESHPGIPALEHDPEKWKPVFRKDHAQTKR
jgi:hypothetical protein